MIVAASLLCLVTVGVGAWRWRPAPRRARALIGAGPRAATQHRSPLVPVRAQSWVAALGRVVRRGLRRPDDPEADRHLGRALLAAAALGMLSPVLVLVVALWWWSVPVIDRRRRRRRRDAALVAELPEVVDLFVLAVGAGLTVTLAVEAVARHHRGILGSALADVTRRVALGARMADALAGLPAGVGERSQPLVGVLVSSERYGVALLPALERLAVETRLERRRAAEATARRVPVKLLFPLVLCTLPAFALLTVVPLLAGSLRSLRV